ncbi:MAG: hypothetical protein ACR2KQ_07615 [Actinomycetota bacterium]
MSRSVPTEGARSAGREAGSARLGWLVWWTIVALEVAATALFLAHYPLRATAASLPVAAYFGLSLVTLLVSSLGLIIVSRRGGHVIGWVLMGSGAGVGYVTFSEHYALQGMVVRPGSLPGAELIGGVAEMLGPVVSWIPIILLLTWFPTGRVPSPRWRIIPILLTVAVTLMLVASLTPGRILNIPGSEKPLVLKDREDLLLTAGDFAWLFMTVALLLAAASLVARTVRSRGIERQQLKVVGITAAMVVGGAAVALMSGMFEATPAESAAGFVASALMAGGLLLLPVAVTIALLRYRLYDIDVIVNRALVYGSLTALLAGGYLTIVVFLQRLLEPLTAESDLAIAASTLAVAALFSPLRSRVQAFIDRRFYRRRYDAALAVEGFSRRLRDEIELEAVADGLASVVRETVQPSHLGLWLPDPSGVDISS